MKLRECQNQLYLRMFIKALPAYLISDTLYCDIVKHSNDLRELHRHDVFFKTVQADIDDLLEELKPIIIYH